MSENYKPSNVLKLKMHSINDRKHLSQIDAFAKTPPPKASFLDWLNALPGFLGASRLNAAVDAVIASRAADKPVVFAMGAHVVKVGCGPVVIDLMRKGIVSAVAMHGATAIHDVEIAMIGATSEDVAASIRDGRFGMVRETAEFFAEAAKRAAASHRGYGRLLGEMITDLGMANTSSSILAAAAELDVPATVHVALGTDTVHMAAAADGAAIGAATLRDFRLICNVVEHMGADTSSGACGTWCNIGSAVILPEIFLKAVSVARNLGADLDRLNTINMDQLRHYRPNQNVVGRPVAPGRGFDISGHHEIMLPLLRQAIIERLQ